MSVIRNTGYNLASSIVPIAVSLLTVPLYIRTIGEARYGVLALVGLLLGYFGVFDLGLSTATAQRIAAAPSDDYLTRREVFWTATAINAAMGLVGTVILLPVAWIFAHRTLKAPPEMVPEITQAVGWLIVAFPVMLLTGVLRGALQGAERFAELNLINVIVSPISQLVPLGVALWMSPKLTVVLPALYLTRVLFLGCYAFVIGQKVLQSWKPVVSRARVRDLVSFGGWVTVSSLIGPLMTALDRFLIGSFLGLRAVSYYSVPYQLAERSLILPGALLQALFPRITAADDVQSKILTVKGLRALAVLMAPPITAGIVFIHPFLALWIGRQFADAATSTGQILLAGFWFNALGMSCLIRLQAMGRPRLVATAHMIELLPYFAVLALSMKLFGLPGAAFAFSLRVFADDWLLAGYGGILVEVIGLTLGGLALFLVAGIVGSGLELALTWQFGAGLGIAGAVGITAMAWLHSQRQSIGAALKFS